MNVLKLKLLESRQYNDQHLNGGTFSDTVREDVGTFSRCSCVTRLQRDHPYRHKVLYTACIYSGFAVIGWIKGQIGPSLNDLLYISGVGLEKGSWIVTTFFIGYTVGSLASAFLYEKMNRKCLFCACQLVLVVMLLIIPWCHIYELMVVAHFIKGMAEGVIDPVSNTEILRLWEEKARVYIIGLNLSLSLGSIVSPLVTAPFLTEFPTDTNDSSLAENRTLINGHSQLYKAYSITASIAFCVGISFLALYVTSDEDKTPTKGTEFTENETSQLPGKYVTSALVIMAAMLFFFNAIDEAYVSYLSTFCIEYLKWTKSRAAFITSVMFILVFVSRIVCLLLVKCLHTVTLIGMQCFLMVLSFLGLLISASLHVDSGVWVSAPMVGYSKSVIFGLVFAWTDEYFIRVTGRLSSAFFVIAMIGSSINPVILGFIMKRYSNLWFCFLFMIQSVLLFGLFILGAVFSRHILQKYGTRFRKIKDVNG